MLKSNLIKYGVIAVLAVFLVIFVSRACKLTDKNSELHGIIEVKDSLLKQQEGKTAVTKEAYEKALKDQDADIAHWQEVAEKNAKGITASTSEIRDLKEQMAKLNPAEKDAIIETQAKIITAQENKIAENITLTYNALEAKDRVIADWEVKFVKWETYRVELETENAQLHSLNDSREALIAGLEKDLRWSRLTGRTKNIVIAAVGAYMVYSLVNKK